ncbi:MAG: hypothetical protein JSS70_15510 [Bacteroidetes bacterium]|nr:hypothetical protein [Bacteroidota bacterium]
MNKILIRLGIPFFLFLFSCQKNDNSSNNSSGNPSQGNWHITLFSENGTDKTADFNGYIFIFGSDGVLTVQRGAISKTGSWNSGANFSIDLGENSDNNKPQGEITGTWKIISITDTEIKLTDDKTPSQATLNFAKL